MRLALSASPCMVASVAPASSTALPAICAEATTWRPISAIDDDNSSVPEDTVCTFTEVSSAADATALTSALDWSAVADMLWAVVCIELAELCRLSSAARTAPSNSTMRASMRVARSALARRSLSCSVESARPSIMLSRNTCSAFAIAAISSCWAER